MKKTLLLLSLLLSFGLFSCSDDDDPNPQTELEEIEEINPMAAYTPLERKVATNEILLGKGYDITGTYISEESTREAVIDFDKYINENPDGYGHATSPASYSHSAIGTTSSEYIKHLTSISSNSYWNEINGNVAAFSGTILDNKNFDLRDDETLSTYSYASTHTYVITESFYLYHNPLLLISYITESFAKDISSLSANKIVEKYGTHVINEYSVGGRFDMIYRSKINDNSGDKERIVRAGSFYAASQLGISLFNSDSDSGIKELVNQNKLPIAHVVSQGGDNSIACGTYNLQKEFTKLNYYEWFKSLTSENASLVDMRLDRMIPIYELVADSKKQAEIKTAVEKYIEDRQIK
ncbi:MAC/perforin domain-containing protein [Dysgonomonas sp. ZJ709]|uniref:MAC/perforin domain-containing protein n=1 Tax=Dysgonomonas sp. ZJ709 TaxID=2709797 RepID=UPI0013EDADBF|nr:MAC/perforin domain-containing protein [Dysgonomonas sp. ZJ709]